MFYNVEPIKSFYYPQVLSNFMVKSRCPHLPWRAKYLTLLLLPRVFTGECLQSIEIISKHRNFEIYRSKDSYSRSCCFLFSPISCSIHGMKTYHVIWEQIGKIDGVNYINIYNRKPTSDLIEMQFLNVKHGQAVIAQWYLIKSATIIQLWPSFKSKHQRKHWLLKNDIVVVSVTIQYSFVRRYLDKLCNQLLCPILMSLCN